MLIVRVVMCGICKHIVPVFNELFCSIALDLMYSQLDYSLFIVLFLF